MSDFLTHLAHRALTPQPAVRPRLQSFFEPPPAHAPVVREEHAEIPAEPLRISGPTAAPPPVAAEQRPAIQPRHYPTDLSPPERAAPAVAAAPPPILLRETPPPPPAKAEPSQNTFATLEPALPHEPREHRRFSAEKNPPRKERPVAPLPGRAESVSEKHRFQTNPDPGMRIPRPEPAGSEISSNEAGPPGKIRPHAPTVVLVKSISHPRAEEPGRASF